MGRTKLLKMLPDLIAETKAGRKTGTSRLENKGKGRFELVEPDGKRSGVIIDVQKVIRWTFYELKFKEHAATCDMILKAEGYKTMQELRNVLTKIYAGKIGDLTPIYTHIWPALPADSDEEWLDCDLIP